MADHDWLKTRFGLDGKRVLVTGASRGIGQALALGLAEAGADLVISARSLAALEPTAARVRALGREVQALACDQSDVAAIRSAFAGLQVDALINNAGVEDVRPAADIDEALWDKIVDTNLKGAFFTAQAVAAGMKPGASIVNLASLTSFVGVPTAVPYGASKTGVLGLTRALATEWGPKGIRVNAIAPGFIETSWHKNRTPESYERINRKIALHRFGEISEVADMAYEVLKNGYMNGSVVDIHGGYDYF